MPCNFENLTFKAFISAETWHRIFKSQLHFYLSKRATYPRLVVRLLLLFLQAVALEHRPVNVHEIFDREMRIALGILAGHRSNYSLVRQL